MSRLRSPFQRLQWRLTLSYTLVSTGALLVVELLLFGVILAFIGSDVIAEVMSQSIEQQLVEEIRPFLNQTPPDLEGLRAWTAGLLDTQTQITPGQPPQQVQTLDLGNLRINEAEQVFYVLSPDLTVLAVVPPQPDLLDAPLPTAPLGEAAQALTQARELSTAVRDQQPNGARLVVVPILAGDNSVLGLAVLTFQLPLFSPEVLAPIGQAIGLTLIPFTLATALIGTLFGFITARGLTRRITAMSQAADAWSQGDFSVVARDPSGDELGQLSRRLNRMAEQLQNLLDTRQALATIEERNRLARDLHDSVKQQIFATTMQLAAARTLLETAEEEGQENSQVRQYVAEAEQLARQAQQELTGLIQELRPAALAGQGLPDALRDFVVDWSRRTQIAGEVRVQEARPLPLAVEQTLFRITQEALANVARHSRAERVVVGLSFVNHTAVSLTIQDNGQGFDPTQNHFGLGLDSMRERLQAHEGQFTLTSQPGKGTTITAVVPLV